jgi:hypothetical protein
MLRRLADRWKTTTMGLAELKAAAEQEAATERSKLDYSQMKIGFEYENHDEAKGTVRVWATISPNMAKKHKDFVRELGDNPYKVEKLGARSFRGNFSNWPDWQNYASLPATRHPANEVFNDHNGRVPKPVGQYQVPGGDTPGNLHTTDWRKALMEKAKDHQTRLQDAFRNAHPGEPLPPGRFWNEAQKATEEDYASYGLGWRDLDLQGWSEHHIHEVNWGGAPFDSANTIYLRNREHEGFSAFWKFHKAAITATLDESD